MRDAARQLTPTITMDLITEYCQQIKINKLHQFFPHWWRLMNLLFQKNLCNVDFDKVSIYSLYKVLIQRKSYPDAWLGDAKIV